MRFYQIYQFAAPALLFPISYWLWWQRYGGDHRMVLIVLSLPIGFAYVIPGIGTNVLHLWEFNTRFRLGRFRPHHGLVFGSATSLFALITLTYPLDGEATVVLRDGFILGSVLGFWNWLYDIYAIKVGFIKVYTRRQSEGGSAAEIATDYAPALFGMFGFCYGLSVRSLESLPVESSHFQVMWLLLLCQTICLTVPVLAYVATSYLSTGQSGLRSYKRVGHEV